MPRGAWIEKSVIKHEQLTLSGASTPPTEQLYVYAQRDFCPSNLQVTAALTYQQYRGDGKNGQPLYLLRSAVNQSFDMPTSLFLRSIDPSKDTKESKLQFSFAAGLMTRNLPEIFEDLFLQQKPFDESIRSEGRNLTFRYHDNTMASILISREGTKIKLQTDTLDKQWLVLRELSIRL